MESMKNLRIAKW